MARGSNKNPLGKQIKITAIVAVLFLGAGLLTQFGSAGSDGITSWLGPENGGLSLGDKLKIVIDSPAESNSLFDVILAIPEDYREISQGEDLVMSIELTNIGLDDSESQIVEGDLTHIVTNTENGDVVFIEHETVDVRTQTQFLKTLNLQELSPGNYKVFTELIYAGNKWAAASESFRVSRWE